MACMKNLSFNTHPKPMTYQQKIKLLVKDEEVKNYFKIVEDGIEMYASPENKQQGIVECKVYESEKEEFIKFIKQIPDDSLASFYQQKGIKKLSEIVSSWNNVLMNKPLPQSTSSHGHLKGMRVALDPGHLGGTMETAMIEARYVIMAFQKGDTVRFNEGNLNLATAYLLKQKLEAEGAEVMITRNAKGHSAFDKSFEQWLKDDFANALEEEKNKGKIDITLYQKLKTSKDLPYIYDRFFKYLDFRERARKINAFQPHLTIVIHYNIDSPNWDRRKEDVYQPSDANYSMVFLAGGFMKKELADPRDRMEFLRLLLSDDLDNSLQICEKVQHKFVHDLKVPSVPHDDRLSYLKRGCVYADKEGIYARNLALTRMVRSPLCYGETLCQDDGKEARALAKEEIPAGDLMTSPRVAETAHAYFEAIHSYWKKHK
jgi:N-acetylmuramoyl-L-alanine amidase